MSILILGDNSVSVKQLLKHIVTYDDICTGTDSCRSIDIVDNDNGLSIIDNHSISNKYYNANLTLYGYTVVNAAATTDIATISYEGLILVIPYEMRSDGDKLLWNNIRTIGEESSSNELVSLRLLVVYWSNSNQELPEEAEALRDQRLAWSLANAFEYVEVDADDLCKTWQDREKDGLPRIIEAIQSTSWSTIVRKDLTKQVVPSITTTTAPAIVCDESKLDDSLNVDSDDLSSIIEEASKIRDEAVQGEVSDNDRRCRAAEFALKLAQMMNLDDDDDEDSDDER